MLKKPDHLITISCDEETAIKINSIMDTVMRKLHEEKTISIVTTVPHILAEFSEGTIDKVIVSKKEDYQAEGL